MNSFIPKDQGKSISYDINHLLRHKPWSKMQIHFKKTKTKLQVKTRVIALFCSQRQLRSLSL